MNIKKILQNLSFFFLLIISFVAVGQKRIQLKSPDGNIVFKLAITSSTPVYSVIFKGETIIEPSSLSLSFEKGGRFWPRPEN